MGVVCDGCSRSQSGVSNNEVGARLISVALSGLVGTVVAKSGVKSIGSRISGIERQLCTRILKIASATTVNDRPDDLMHGLFMTTILGFAVDDSHFCIFGCGDGIFMVNGKWTVLEEEGAYLAGRLMSEGNWKDRLSKGDGALRIYRDGVTGDLQQLLVGSDGWQDIQQRFGAEIDNLMVAVGRRAGGIGFDPAVPTDFRASVWHTPGVRQWAESQDRHDDRSFLLLQRVHDATRVLTADASGNAAPNLANLPAPVARPTSVEQQC